MLPGSSFLFIPLWTHEWEYPMGYIIARTDGIIRESHRHLSGPGSLEGDFSPALPCPDSFLFLGALWGRCHHPHLTKEETETQRSKVVNARAKIGTKVAWFQRWRRCVSVGACQLAWGIGCSSQAGGWRLTNTDFSGRRWILPIWAEDGLSPYLPALPTQDDFHWLSL